MDWFIVSRTTFNYLVYMLQFDLNIFYMYVTHYYCLKFLNFIHDENIFNGNTELAVLFNYKTCLLTVIYLMEI